MPDRSGAPLIALSANQAWHLVNFRSGLIAALRSAGCRVLALAPPDPQMEARLAELGCGFEPVPFDAMGLSPSRDLATFVAICRALRRHRPDAWLSWTVKPNVYGTLAAALTGIPALPNVSGLGTAFIRTSPITRAVKLLYRVGFRRAHRVFFQNDDDARLFIAEGLVRPEQACRLPGSGIDLEHFRPPEGPRPARRCFLMIARIVADKGVREFAEAARRLRSRWPDARFVLLGPLDVQNRTAISADEVRGWELAGVLQHQPPTQDVRGAIAQADFVVLPSYREGLSRVLLEAGAMGRPIVTTDVPGCRDVVSEGENGFLCRARDATALEQALERAARTEDADWHRMAAAGRQRVEAQFSQPKVTGVYLQTLAALGILPLVSSPEAEPLPIP